MKKEHLDNFLQECLELARTFGYTEEQAKAIVKHTFKYPAPESRHMVWKAADVNLQLAIILKETKHG